MMLIDSCIGIKGGRVYIKEALLPIDVESGSEPFMITEKGHRNRNALESPSKKEKKKKKDKKKDIFPEPSNEKKVIDLARNQIII
jgi:hypothetical protein